MRAGAASQLEKLPIRDPLPREQLKDGAGFQLHDLWWTFQHQINDLGVIVNAFYDCVPR